MNASRAVSFAALFGFVFWALTIQIVSAQLGFPGLESSALITTEPPRPSPGDTVRLSTKSVLLDLSNMNVTWKVNGTIIAEGVGQTEAEFAAGPLGSTYEVVMSAYSNTHTAYTSITVVPTEMDVLFEAASFVPPFYGGRSLPSEGSKVRAEAIVRFKRPNGSYITNDAITYTWRQNDSVVSAVSGKGKSSALLPSPVLFGGDTISVTASAENDLYFAHAETNVPSVEPLVLLYQDHPLFGILYHKALAGDIYISEREATFVASPYFASAENSDDRTLNYGWRVDGKSVPQDDVRRSAITINTGDRDTGTVVDLVLTQSTNPFFEARGRWPIVFSISGDPRSEDVGNPFTRQR